jgi:hypothetical protein
LNEAGKVVSKVALVSTHKVLEEFSRQHAGATIAMVHNRRGRHCGLGFSPGEPRRELFA